jgi:hypothetical protein
MPKPAHKGGAEPVVVAVLIGQLLLVPLGVAWWIINLGTRPHYGDSNQYLQLAESLHVDEFRTLLYPLVLRGLETLAMFFGCRLELLVDFVQTILALLSIAYLGRTLWEVTASTERFSYLKRVAALPRQAVIGAFAMLVFSQPLVNHFALSLMTDSLAASFTTAGLASLIRISALDDTRMRTFVIGWFTIAAAGFERAEKVYVMGLTVLVAMVATWWLARPTVSLHSSQMLSRCPRALALLTALLLTPGSIVTIINRATQTTDYGWPPVTVNVRLFVRTVWPRLTELRPLLSQEFQAAVSETDAKDFDAHYDKYLQLVPLLQRHAGGTDVLVNEASWAAIRYHPQEIAIRTAMDAVRYAIPLIAYPADLVLGAPVGNASGWTHGRMREARPLLTDVYLWIATAILLIIQIPIVCSLIVRLWGKWNQRIVLAAGLMLGLPIINAVLYSLGNGNQNVRYALPACVLMFAAIVWGNLVWLAAYQGRRILRYSASERSLAPRSKMRRLTSSLLTRSGKRKWCVIDRWRLWSFLRAS